MFTVIDGGLSTALEEVGADISGPLWTARAIIESPDLLERAHRSFVEAGSDIIATASYQCGANEFESLGMSNNDASAALASTVTIARRAVRGSSVRVAASVGPFGAMLANGSEYNGRYGVSWSAVEEYHRSKLRVLVDAGADLVAVETIPLADEARLIAEILEDLGAPPAWFSFGAASGSLTYGGDTLVSAVGAVTGYANLVAVGVNCAHPDVVDAAVETISGLSNGSLSAAPIIAYPNHGRSWDAASRQWVGVGVNSFETSRIEALVSRGATYIGGCCGVGAAGIARLVAIRDDAVA